VTEEENTKKCTKCKEVKPKGEFYKNKSTKDGLQGACKACYSAYHEANRPAILEKQKAYHEANPEKEAKRKKAYNEANRPAMLEQQSAYWKANKARITIRHREYCRAHKGQMCARTRKRKASKLNATPSWFEKDAVLAVYTESATRSKTEGVLYHVDHIVPLQSKLVCGLHCLANLQILTSAENIRKGNRHWPGQEWIIH
jgi:phage terminase large subunit-like protein